MTETKKTSWLKRNKWKILIGTVVALVLSLAIPLPYYIEMPGDSTDVRRVLQVNGKEDEASGEYQFVTIQMAPANLPMLIYAWLTPFTDIQAKDDVTGGGSNQDFMRINQFYMESSQNMATYQGLKAAGKKVEMKYEGVYVLNVTKDSSFKGLLNIADTVTKVNDKSFDSSPQLIEYVSSQKIGDKVKVTYQEDGKTKEAEGKIIKLQNGKNGIGIGLTDHTSVQTDTKIDFSTVGIGGPSAGLMFSLDIYTQVAEPNLRNGRVIAGTGTIEKDGKVGDIGGIDKKVYAAHKAGASIFFAPNNPVTDEMKKINPKAKTNYETAVEAAKQLKTDMKIVPVTSLQDAITYLKTHS